MKMIVASLLLLAGCATPAAREPEAIEQAGWVTLGGIEQWVTIRGGDDSNPVLLVVHGGPGFAFSPFAEEFAPFEADFTVVQWDQRGAGRTFGRYGPNTPEFTLDRIARDGVELAAYLDDRLGERPIIVLGHSLGTGVAIDMVQRAPQRFAAYVGTAQESSFQAMVDAQLAYLRTIGEAEGDAELIAQLDAIGAPEPVSLQDFFSVNRLLAPHVPDDDAAFFAHIQARAPEVMTPDELADWGAGRQASAEALMPQAVDDDLFVSAPRLAVPVIVIQGGDDIYTPVAPATAYFESLEAPYKELVLIDGAGHFPFFTHTDAFLAALRRTALPLAADAD